MFYDYNAGWDLSFGTPRILYIWHVNENSSSHTKPLLGEDGYDELVAKLVDIIWVHTGSG